jgi:hypothetical protein
MQLWDIKETDTSTHNLSLSSELVIKRKDVPVVHLLSTMLGRFMAQWKYSSTILDLGIR